jgi:hypothetical protein
MVDLLDTARTIAFKDDDQATVHELQRVVEHLGQHGPGDLLTKLWEATEDGEHEPQLDASVCRRSPARCLEAADRVLEVFDRVVVQVCERPLRASGC